MRPIVWVLFFASASLSAATPKKVIALEALYQNLNAPHQALVATIFKQIVDDHRDRIAADPKEVERLLAVLEKNKDNFFGPESFEYFVYLAATLPWFGEVEPGTGEITARLNTGWALPGYRSLARLEALVVYLMKKQSDSGKATVPELFLKLEGLGFSFQTCGSYLTSALAPAAADRKL